MLVTGGDTDITTYFQMRLTAGGDATALTITDFDLSYTRSGATTAAKVDCTDLGSANAAHADNKGYEVDATDCPGLHRFDWPDAAFAAGVREVLLTVKHTSCFTETLRVEIDGEVNMTKVIGEAVSTGGTAGYLDVNVKEWKDAAAPTIATEESIIDSIWDEDATGHTNIGTFGSAIGDPAANTESIYDAVVTDAAGTNVAADVVAVKAETASILTDTAEIGAAGVGLTSVALANATSDAVIADAVWNAATATYGSAGSYGLVIETATGTDSKVLISTDAQDLSGTLDVNTKTITAGIVDDTALGVLTNASFAFVDANERVNVGTWLSQAVTVTAGNKPQVDVYSINNDVVTGGGASKWHRTP